MDHGTEPSPAPSLFTRLNALPDWRFTGTLYLLRWAIILPLSLALLPLASADDAFPVKHSPWAYLLPFLVFAPTLETLIECSLPYVVLHRVFKLSPQSPWPFVVVSATAMVLLHPLTPIVMAMAFITGSFLAYVYAHFAPAGHGKAFLHTAVFHAAINAVSWTMMFIQSIA